jgi:photosystem II stability/assembly factor-like uncharacterized protein
LLFRFALLLLAERTFASDYISGIACSADGKQVFAARVIGVFTRSMDGGLTWKTNQPGINWSSLACSADGGLLIAGGFYNVHTSTNSGDNWETHEVPSSGTSSAVGCSSDGSRLIAASAAGFVLTSTNAGKNWRTNDLPSWRWAAVASSADGTKLAVAASAVGSPGGIFTTTNGGNSWISNEVPAGVRWVSLGTSADGTRLVAGGRINEGVFLSTYSGERWTKVTNGPADGVTSCSAEGSVVMAQPFSDHLYRSTNFGETWISIGPTNFTFPATMITSADGNRVYRRIVELGIERVEALQFPVRPKLKPPDFFEAGLALSWTIPSSNFVVERASELSPTNWIGAGLTPSLLGYDYKVLISSNALSSGQQYLRLRLVP